MKSKTSKNTSKRNKNDNLIPWAFTKVQGKQPTPEQKKAWRERKRQAQRIMDMILKYQTMTTGDLREYMEKNKETLTVLEYTMMKYVTEWMKDKKMMIDMINRHIPYAPTKTEITGEDWGALSITTVKYGTKDTDTPQLPA